ncbi:hypothetical protein M514_08881 [Trichuris suis]|uniref:Uncharacterized protein n=1 Tax=Trichuris suis TaxID=68888 RepID=A0A085LZ57_9BILA|nr:hypothetical protein M513_08881 [Trichuris suis]KFD66936.1 hypothetical protein M514_08881 [Trichuris suis]
MAYCGGGTSIFKLLFGTIVSREVRHMLEESVSEATYIGETRFTLAHRFLQHVRHLTRYNSAKQELEETSSITTTRRGRPSSLPVSLPWSFNLYKNFISMFCDQCYGREQQLVVSIRFAEIMLTSSPKSLLNVVLYLI